jgi:NADPH:quinone reductase-like Zn-dependent oxidoreductase
VHAAAIPLSGLTAWQALHDHGQLSKGQRVLLHGGAGGVGNFAVQLARTAGAEVITTAAAADRGFLRAIGANEILDYRAEPFEERVREIDLVIDTVGGSVLERSFAVTSEAARSCRSSSRRTAGWRPSTRCAQPSSWSSPTETS